jgi:predicted phage tail component-like protein
MIRINQAWFEFAGVRNTNMGVILMSMPVRYHPAERGTSESIPGRSGNVWTPDNAYESITVQVQCLTEDGANLNAIHAWLSGAGALRFSDEPNYVYEARIVKAFARSSQFTRFTAQAFTVVFDCQPYKYLATQTPITVTVSGTDIVNPGSLPAKPLLTVYGTGDGILAIGNIELQITGMETSIAIDCDPMIAYTGAGTDEDPYVLQTGKLSGDWPELLPGSNIVTFSGDITSVVISPRWRWL